MIECDIVFGYLIDDPSRKLQPVMAHPPALTSDITLKNFLTQILNFNKEKTQEKQKGVKLDFKSTETYQQSLPILIELWSSMNYPVWINADIYRGPLKNTETTPVDAEIFFQGIKSLPNCTLSTGWTTRWGANYSEGQYTDLQVNEMIDGIKRNQIKKQPITFPVRAGIASQSITQLDNLFNSLKDSNTVTFTIWSSDNDFVDVEKLRKMIFHFGIDKVYVDVPRSLSDKLRLDDETNAGFSLSSNLLSYSLLFLSVLKTIF
jgi:hypothetical protein